MNKIFFRRDNDDLNINFEIFEKRKTFVLQFQYVAAMSMYEYHMLLLRVCKSAMHCCFFMAFMFMYFHLTKDWVTFFQPETFVASFLYCMLLVCKVFINHFWN